MKTQASSAKGAKYESLGQTPQVMRREILGSAVTAKYRVAVKNRRRFCMLEDYFAPSALGTLNAASLGRSPRLSYYAPLALDR